MNFKRLALFSVIFFISLLFAEFNSCGAVSVYEQYHSCFVEKSSKNINILNTSQEDRECLKTMILNEGKEFSRYLGFGMQTPSPEELLESNGNDLSLTIKDSEERIVGQIILDNGSNFNQLSVSYWIGKDFRGNGYAHLAVSDIISKIWKINDAVSFEFWIDDENIASIKTLEKTCKDLNIDSNSPESETFIKGEPYTFEMKVIRNNTNPLIYGLELYCNGVMIDSGNTTKNKLLEDYSEGKLESGVLFKSVCRMYLIKSVK